MRTQISEFFTPIFVFFKPKYFNFYDTKLKKKLDKIDVKKQKNSAKNFEFAIKTHL